MLLFEAGTPATGGVIAQPDDEAQRPLHTLKNVALERLPQDVKWPGKAAMPGPVEWSDAKSSAATACTSDLEDLFGCHLLQELGSSERLRIQNAISLERLKVAACCIPGLDPWMTCMTSGVRPPIIDADMLPFTHYAIGRQWSTVGSALQMNNVGFGLARWEFAVRKTRRVKRIDRIPS
jgi:hypothetical protein